MASRHSISDILGKLHQVHGDVVSLDVDTFTTMAEKARFIHKQLGEWWAAPVKVITCKQNHPDARKPKIDDVKKSLRDKHGDTVSIIESTFKNVSSKATFVDVEYGEWESQVMKVAFYGAVHPKRAAADRGKHLKNLMETTDLREKISSGVSSSMDKIKSTNVERYGVESVFKLPDYHKMYGTNIKTEEEKQKTKEARLLRHKLKRRELRKNIPPKPKALTTLSIEGKSLKSIWEDKYQTKVSYSYLCKSVNRISPTSLKELDDLVQTVCNGSDIENLTSKMLDIPIYNRFAPGTNSKPDFKINDKLYVNVDGLYWHSEKLLENDYHFKMREGFEKVGSRLLQFRADEVIFKSEIVKSIVEAKSGISKRVYARKTELVNVDTAEAMKFLNDNHLMGASGATFYIGLKYGDKLLCLAALSIKDNKCKVVRFCSLLGHTVVGGYSKILNYAKKQYNLNEIISFVDLRYGSPKSLINMGFNLEGITLGWKWTDYTNTFNRLKCRANMDDRKLTQAQHAKELKLVKIYDAGQAKMVWKK